MANTYNQGALIRARIVVSVNAEEWNVYQSYVTGDYVTAHSKTWKAMGASVGSDPAADNADWSVDSGLIDPDTISWGLKINNGTEVVYTLTSPSTILVRDSKGRYRAMMSTIAASGTYQGRAWTTGTGQDAEPWTATVRPTNIPML